MILSDLHTHTTFSPDGEGKIENMIETAISKGVKYYGISEHFDYDYIALDIKIDGKTIPFIDDDAYFKKARVLQQKYKNDIDLLVGCEFGFNDDENTLKMYEDVIKKYSPDYIVNSVHTVDGFDCWFENYFIGKTKEQAYNLYFEKVLKSLDAKYHFDIVAHLGYVSRNAIYNDNKIVYNDYKKILDEILLKIINLDKILEINTNSRGAGSEFLPDTDIIERYFSLGGRKVCFGSDAHKESRILDKYELVINSLKKIGFSNLTVPYKNKQIKIDI